jgi:hypothetical protein
MIQVRLSIFHPFLPPPPNPNIRLSLNELLLLIIIKYYNVVTSLHIIIPSQVERQQHLVDSLQENLASSQGLCDGLQHEVSSTRLVVPSQA